MRRTARRVGFSAACRTAASEGREARLTPDSDADSIGAPIVEKANEPRKVACIFSNNLHGSDSVAPTFHRLAAVRDRQRAHGAGAGLYIPALLPLP